VRSKADQVASLIQRTAQKRKNKEKIKTKASSSEETVRIVDREGSPGERSETTRGRICERGIKLGVKERAGDVFETEK